MIEDMNFVKGAARFFSALFSPLLMATYGVALAMWLSFLCFLPLGSRLIVILETFLATAAIPIIAIFVLSRIKVIKDPFLNDKGDRTWPYIIETLCFIGMGVYFYYVNAPAWLSLFMLGGAVALIILTVVNHWWKISGHATGMGGLCAMLFFLMMSGNTVFSLQWEFMVAILIAGIVCSSRLILQRHTLLQVAAGFLNGFVCVYCAAWLVNS